VADEDPLLLRVDVTDGVYGVCVELCDPVAERDGVILEEDVNDMDAVLLCEVLPSSRVSAS